MTGMKSLFGNRFIKSILLSGLLLQMGIWVRNFAILMFVSDQTGKNPVAISLISVAEYAPIFLFSFIGGAFADRWRPKRTMVLCDLLSAVSVFAVMFAVIYGGWQAIFFTTMVSSILSQFSQPSAMKMFKLHVPDSLMQAGMSLHQTLTAVFTILGPILGTMIYFQFGIYAAMILMGICFLLSAAVLTKLPSDRNIPASAPSRLKDEIRLGFSYVKSKPIFLYMIGFYLAAGLALGILNPLGIFLVTEHLGLSQDALQWFTAINGFGIVVGGITVMALSRKIPPHAMLIFGFFAIAVAVAVLGTTHSVGIALLCQWIAGIMVPLIHIACSTMVIQNTEQAFVGRVNGILSPMFIGAMVLDMALAGPLKAVVPLGGIYLLAAALFAGGGLASFPLLTVKHAHRQTAVEHVMHHH